MAASWAWGSSLMVGMTNVWKEGLWGYLLWGIANVLAIPVTGYMFRQIAPLRAQMNQPIIRIFMGFLQIFVLWVNAEEIHVVMQLTHSFSEWMTIVIPMLISFVLLLLVTQRGLERSMRFDQIQWATLYSGLILIIILAIRGHLPLHPLLITTKAIPWGLLAAASLLAGPSLEMAQWQRTRLALQEGQVHAFKIAGIAFAIYLSGVFIIARFILSPTLLWILLGIGIVVATGSTISGGAALYELTERRRWTGFMIGVLALAIWPFVAQWGILVLWTLFGTWRIFIVSGMWLIAAIKKWKLAYAR